MSAVLVVGGIVVIACLYVTVGNHEDRIKRLEHEQAVAPVASVH